jgi:hypothetical protein
MPDAITPVGTMYPPQNPIAALSSIYGIQQQQVALKQAQQNLQTGQYAQQSAQAEAQQNQQKNSELTAVGNLTKQAYSSGRYKQADGSFDNQKFADDVSQVAPTYGQQIAKDATMRAGEIYKNQQTFFNLNQSQRQMIGDAFGSLAADASVDHTKFIDTIANLSDQFKDNPQVNRMLTSMATAIPNDNGPGLRQALRNAAVMTNAPSAAQSNPNVGAIGLGGSVALTQTNPQAIGGLQQQGSVTDWSLTEDPITHNKYMINAQTGESRPLGGAAGNTANAPPQRPAGQGESQKDVATTDAARYSQISQEGTNAQTGAQLADRVAALADQVRTGKLSKEWADNLTIFQQDNPGATARQMLTKYAAQLKTMASQGASTDASRSQVDAGMPSPETMDPKATKQAAQYVGGIFRMRGARQQYADQYLKNNGSPLGMQGADDAFMRAADPSVFVYKSLPAGAARQQYLRDSNITTPEKLQDLKTRLNQVNHYSGGQ